ncbi:MAG: hypothetical protein LBG60_13165 [Bifidobacteriaceae bacterium]|jgi:hypothetical protein|nr:hypothetical protein [Bifidobacteriaceae bacterium]
MKSSKLFKVAVGVFGASVLALMGQAAASADPAEVDDEDVKVTVTISPLGAGALTLSVASPTAALSETGATPTVVREFTGTLPNVTVRDTRDPDDVADSAAWSVVGQATDFSDGGTNTIPSSQLGWTPAMAAGSDDGLGTVTEGQAVGTSLDSTPDVGLAASELLYMAGSSADLLDLGESAWSATADLVLKTSPTQATGNYSSTLTLSLFE